MFLVEKGVHIMEGMNLTSLADAGVYEFLFVVAPIKVVGATGMPVRPFALA
jgi:kynurenine formamidase